VYKQGQAGVTKASVSIVFNNSDSSRSPVGYEHCEQLTVTRQVGSARAAAQHAPLTLTAARRL
jgi:chromosome segregation ATPase